MAAMAAATAVTTSDAHEPPKKAVAAPASVTLPPGAVRVIILVRKNGTCVTQDPTPARVLMRRTRVVEMVADAGNQVPVTISYKQDPAEIFEHYPKAPFVLRPGATPEVFVVRRDLGLEARGTFENANPRYARAFNFLHSPTNDCPDGDHTAVHIER